jgi:hypothetical protein
MWVGEQELLNFSTVLEGNIAKVDNMARWPLRNGVICVTTDGVCSALGRLGSVLSFYYFQSTQ